MITKRRVRTSRHNHIYADHRTSRGFSRQRMLPYLICIRISRIEYDKKQRRSRRGRRTTIRRRRRDFSSLKHYYNISSLTHHILAVPDLVPCTPPNCDSEAEGVFTVLSTVLNDLTQLLDSEAFSAFFRTELLFNFRREFIFISVLILFKSSN
jgi:hypothetical protein